MKFVRILTGIAKSTRISAKGVKWTCSKRARSVAQASKTPPPPHTHTHLKVIMLIQMSEVLLQEDSVHCTPACLLDIAALRVVAHRGATNVSLSTCSSIRNSQSHTSSMRYYSRTNRTDLELQPLQAIRSLPEGSKDKPYGHPGTEKLGIREAQFCERTLKDIIVWQDVA